MAILGTKSNHLPALSGSIPDTQLVLVPDPITGEIMRSTFGQMKADIVLQIGDLSYLDDIIEVPTVSALPQPGQTKKIYVITSGADANKQFRWGGSIYIEFPQGSGDVAGEAILRGNADANLQSQINAEINARQTADANLQTNITNAATASANADTTINNRLSAEINARSNNDGILQGLINSEGVTRLQQDNLLQAQIDQKLNASDYNQHYKGKFTSLAALHAALPTAAPGDYAQVDTGAGNDVKNYNWDDEEGWVIGGTVSASTTDALPEGSTNLYFTPARAQAAVDISGKADKSYVDAADQALSTRIDNLQPASPTGSRIITGCKESWSGTGLTFDVTPGTYEIQGTPLTFPGASVTLVPADHSNGRFDVLVLNDQEQLVIITGTPGINPDIPQVDPDSQLYLTAIYVAAGATTPIDINLSLIYSENAESWVGSAGSGLTVDFNDTSSPFSGTKDIKVSAGTNGGYLMLTADVAPNVTNYSLLKLYLKFATVLNSKSNIVASFYSLNKQVSNFVTLPVNKSLTTYQNISIDLSQFQFTQSLFDTLRITFTGTTFSAFYLDYIQLQGNPGSSPVVQVYDATATVKGILKLAGDLGGTADNPTVPGLAGKAAKTYVDTADANLQTQINAKLDASAYNDRYKGKYTTLAALQSAHPTANAGDYAQVDAGAGSDVINYNYDLEDGWIQGGSGSAATNTDALPEGTTNLYFTNARAAAAVDISGKVDKVAGKQLSTEDYTTAEKTKLAGITAGAQVNDANTTLQGNTFNGISQLVKTDGSGKLPAIDGSQLTGLPSSGVAPNAPITAATKTKITYDAKGLVTSGADATTADIADSADKRYVTDVQRSQIGPIPSNITTQGNTFNGASQLVKTDAAGKLPAVDGSQLTNLPSSGGGGGSPVGVASGTNTYTVSCTPTVTALTVNLCVRVLFTNGNTGASTINVDGTGVKNIYTGPSTALIAGKIAANTIYELYYDGTVWQLGSVQAVPTTPNKVITTNGSGVLQAINDLIDINSTTTESALVAATWTNGQATVTGTPGTKVYGISSGYLYECSGVNTWWRTPFINWVNLYLADVSDGAGIKTSSQMTTLYPNATVGNKAKGTSGFYEYVGGLIGWVYTPYYDKNTIGTATFSGDGSKTTFSVAFAANVALPTVIIAVPNTADAAALFYINNIQISGFDIVFKTAPPAGTNNIIFNYKATR